MGRALFVVLLLGFLFSACGRNDGEFTNLTEYLEVNSEWDRSTELIACAAGGVDFTSANPDSPIAIFFYPQTTAFDFKYFESDNADINQFNFDHYKEVELDVSEVFNGYLRKFSREFSVKDRWAIVSYRLDGTLWTCQPILLKASSNPTFIDNEAVNFEATNTLNPNFTWADNSEAPNAIYFQVISDASGNLITGTYTFDKDFAFYEPEEFTPNITNPLSTPTLESGETYNFTLMGVDEDNWVNLISEQNFSLD